MWQTVLNWPWQSIWAAATFVAAVFAIALWNRQDKLKAKMAFKTAISNYAWQLSLMPEIISFETTRHLPEHFIKDLCSSFFVCMNAWSVSEGIMDSNKKVKKSWDFILSNHNKALSGELETSVLIKECKVIMDEKFVFK